MLYAVKHYSVTAQSSISTVIRTDNIDTIVHNIGRVRPTGGADGREDGLPLDEKAGCPTYTPPPYWPPGSNT